jgi:Domain of unknown function (DUF4430)
VLRRSFVAVVLVLLAVACGESKEEAVGTSGAALDTKAAVLVTSDCGKTTVVKKTVVEPGQTAMRALDRVAEIETDSGGKFVTGIEGVAQDDGKKLAWLYYLNGKAAQKGASEIKLAGGDVEWWDLHNYEQECAVVPPAAR